MPMGCHHPGRTVPDLHAEERRAFGTSHRKEAGPRPNGIEFGRDRFPWFPRPAKDHVPRRLLARAGIFLSGLIHGPDRFNVASNQSVPREAAMDPRIENLKTTTFFGKRLTRRQVSAMQEAVELLPNDSRRELARTLCENLDWHTPSGSCRERFCLWVLEQLESLGILTLPERREPGEPVDAPLRDLEPVTLEVAAGGRDLAEWSELVDRCHPRGCRSPIGCHLAYFVLGGSGRRLGCLMFESSGSLPVRDAWIGWTERQREDGLQRVVRHSRFMVLPWMVIRTWGPASSRSSAGGCPRTGPCATAPRPCSAKPSWRFRATAAASVVRQAGSASEHTRGAAATTGTTRPTGRRRTSGSARSGRKRTLNR